MKRIIMVGMVMSMAFMPGLVAAETGKMERVAITSAEQWLALVDAGNYADSWSAAAEYFKTAISQAQWGQALQAVRQPLGKAVSRQLQRARYKTSLPGVPDGEYVVIQFATSFEHKKSAVETVTPMRDKDGQWRVAGYFIR